MQNLQEHEGDNSSLMRVYGLVSKVRSLATMSIATMKQNNHAVEQSHSAAERVASRPQCKQRDAVPVCTALLRHSQEGNASCFGCRPVIEMGLAAQCQHKKRYQRDCCLERMQPGVVAMES